MLTMNWIENYLRLGNPKVSKQQLTILSRSEHPKIRLRVAENPKTPRDVLQVLAKDNDSDVRLAVATNRAANTDVILKLAQDEDPTVRHGIAEDANAPLQVLQLLANDSNAYVSCRAQKTLQSLGYMEAKSSDAFRFWSWPNATLNNYS